MILIIVIPRNSPRRRRDFQDLMWRNHTLRRYLQYPEQEIDILFSLSLIYKSSTKLKNKIIHFKGALTLFHLFQKTEV